MWRKTREMSSLSNITSDLVIERPELWSLSLSISKKGVRFALYCTEQDNSLIARDIPFDDGEGPTLKKLENAIYDNPILLNDYKTTRISVESMQFMLIPPEYAGESEEIMETMYPRHESDLASCTLDSSDGISIAYLAESGIMAFLSRTFPDAKICHHLRAETEYYQSKQEEGTTMGRMYITLVGERLDVVVFSRGELRFANSFMFSNINDAAYFALAAWSDTGLDSMSDEVQLYGDKESREKLTPILQRYISYVVPGIFPAQALSIGNDAVKAPIDIIYLSL